MAAAEQIERGYLGRLLRLTLLAPDIVVAILNGQQPAGLELPRLLEPFMNEWRRQRAAPELSSGALERASDDMPPRSQRKE